MLAQMEVALLLLHGPDLVQTVSIVRNAWNMPVVPVGLARRRRESLLHGVEMVARTDESLFMVRLWILQPLSCKRGLNF